MKQHSGSSCVNSVCDGTLYNTFGNAPNPQEIANYDSQVHKGGLTLNGNPCIYIEGMQMCFNLFWGTYAKSQEH